MPEQTKKTSTCHLSVVNSNGRWLNGSDIEQKRFLHLEVLDPNQKMLMRACLTFDQFAQLLTSNHEVPCTLEAYRDLNGEKTEEIVERPKTVEDKMKERMGDVHTEIMDRIKDAEKDVYDMINGNLKPGKKCWKN